MAEHLPECLPSSDWSFGPRVDTACRSFDFTLQFEDIVLACVPAAVFLLTLPWNIVALRRGQPTWSTRPNLRIAKQSLLVCLAVLQLAFLVLRSQQGLLHTRASAAADTLTLAATLGSLLLSHLDCKYSLRPSTLLSLYLPAFVVLGVARTRTLWLLDPYGPVPALMLAICSITFVSLILESLHKKASFTQPTSRNRPLKLTPEQYSGFWERASYAWLLATFRLGYATILSVEDLPPMDVQLQSRSLHQVLMATWNSYDLRRRHSLLRASFHAYAPTFLSAVIPRLCLTGFTFAQPFMVGTTVTFMEQKFPDGHYGNGLIGAWALVYLGIAFSTAVYQYQLFRFITKLRGGLTAVVYQHALDTRVADSGEITAVALMGTDIPRIVDSFREIHEIWAAPVDIAVAVYLLARQLSVACVAPIVVTLVFIGASSKLSASTKREQRRWIEKVQERIRVTTAMLNDIKAVKMLGLSDVMENVIRQLRSEEIQTSKGFRILLTIRMVLSNSIVNIAPVLTFGVYVLISFFWLHESLFTAKAFTSITLISLLTKPALVFIQALPAAFQSIGSFDRIQEFANYIPQSLAPETEVQGGSAPSSSDSLGNMTSTPPCIVSDASVVVFGTPNYFVNAQAQSFSWKSSAPEILNRTDLHIHAWRITMVTGAVGSGKSCLLQSILGETFPTSGHALKTSLAPIAYCAQQPWLENTTIRNNIIKGAAYDAKWYMTVQHASGLDQDLSEMAKGDQTNVGSAGSLLSGGQKQRIALARAVYSRCPVVILDDVFSGMDAKTVQHIIHLLLGPTGLFRTHRVTVILATHNSGLLKYADDILALENGKIIQVRDAAAALELGLVDELETLPSAKTPKDEIVMTAEREHEVPRVSSESSTLHAADEEDALSRKGGDPSVYKYYIASSGWSTVYLFIASLSAWAFCTEFPAIWVKWWSDANMEYPNKDIGMYIGVYAVLGAIGSLMVFFIGWLLFVTIISNSGHKLHSDLLQATLRAPYWFFASRDTGSLINRFNQDLELIDMELPLYVINYTTAAAQCIAKLIILAIFSKYLAAAVPVLGVIVVFLQRFYLQTSRQVRLLGIEARAPLYTSFQESVVGSPTIRAFGWTKHYQSQNYRLIDTSQRPEYLQNCIQQWLAFTLGIIVTVMVVVLVTIVVTLRHGFSAGSVGVSLTAVVSFNVVLARVIQMWTSLESSIGAVSRIKKFVAETEPEEKGGGMMASRNMSLGWPQEGAVCFSGVTASHSPEADAVLRGVSMSIKPGQHVAICGRSGSGKTSLILSLLKMLHISSGSISVDSVNISSLDAQNLRRSMTVVTQEPLLFSGSMRFNIDPFGRALDDDIIHALRRVGLWDSINDDGGLDQAMNSSEWSAGQKQLLCLARAMVLPAKIIILDEATSSVDAVAEGIMQNIIESEFKSCTVLAVMHRLAYSTNYDRVAVMDAGVLMEFDAPQNLLSWPSRFRELYETSGVGEEAAKIG